MFSFILYAINALSKKRSCNGAFLAHLIRHMARPARIENGEKTNLYLPAKSKLRLKRLARRRGVSMSETVTQMIAEENARGAKKGGKQ